MKNDKKMCHFLYSFLEGLFIDLVSIFAYFFSSYFYKNHEKPLFFKCFFDVAPFQLRSLVGSFCLLFPLNFKRFLVPKLLNI